MDVKACDICGKRIPEKMLNRFVCPACGNMASLYFDGCRTDYTVHMCSDCASAIQCTMNRQRRVALVKGLNVDFVEEKEDA